MTKKGPRRTRAHVLEELSLQHLKSILPPEWISEEVRRDYGLDVRVELVAQEDVTALEFSVQLKGTDELEVSGGDVLHRCKVSTAHYFLRRPEPVMYVVYDAAGDVAYWVWVQPYLKGLDGSKPGWREQKRVQIRIPERSRLTKACIPAIAEHVAAWWEGRAAKVGWPSAPTPTGAPFTVPPDLVTFTGREELLGELDGLLEPGGTAAVAIVGLRGMAGVGKSALAVHAAHRWRERFPDGVVWVDLRAEKDPCQALRHVAGVYGYREDAAKLGDDRQALVALFRTLLQGKRSLLILDNAEGLGAEDLDCLLPGVAGPVTVVTSRKEFAALSKLGKRLRVDVMEMGEALALLGRLVGEERVEEEREGYERLAERLGRLPLALDIGGRRMADRGWGPGEMMRRLEGARDLPVLLALPVAEKPEESVALAFALSYDGLGAGEQELFRALGPFAAGGVTARAVAGVRRGQRAGILRGALEWIMMRLKPESILGMAKEGEGQAGAVLERLEALSLVRRAEAGTEAQGERVEDRYDLHPLVRDYARALSAQAGDADRWAERHARYFLALADWGGRQLGNPETALAAVGSAAAERGNLLAAQEACVWLGLWDEAVSLAYDLNNLFERSGHWADRRTVLEAGIEAAREGGRQRDEAGLAHNLGMLAQQQGDYPKARRLYQEAADTFEKLGARQEQAAVLHNLGALAQDQGDYPEARCLYQESLDIKQQLGNRAGVARSLHQLGRLAEIGGDYPEARRLYRESLDIARQLGNRAGVAKTLHNLGMLAEDQGNYPEARRLYQESLEIERQLGNRAGVAKTLHQLGNMAYLQGDYPEARRPYREAAQTFEELGARGEQAAVLHQLGMLAEEDGNLAEAERLFGESTRTLGALGSPNGEMAGESLERVRGRTG